LAKKFSMKKNKCLKFSFNIIFLLILIIPSSCDWISQKSGLLFSRGEAQWVKNTMKNMTLEEKISQMITWRFSGYFFNRDSDYVKKLKSLIVDRRIGGLILFGGNTFETAYLTNTFQNQAKIPLLIASDFEKGVGHQIEEATQFPSLMAMGAIGSEKLAYLMGKITAVEGKALGIHMTYAPVVDVNINPENPIINIRSFGENPEQVSRLAKAFIKGCQKNGLIATAKHFPGHGDTYIDSHNYLPAVRADLKRLERVELFPFKQVIKGGVQAVMTAHIHLPSFDATPNLPATLSPVIITGLLRDKLGFKGIVVSDAMDMGGITTICSPEEAALKAVKAGVDILILPPEPDKVIEALVQAVSSGQITEERIDASVRRILEAKARLGLHKNKLVKIDALNKVVASKKHLQQAVRMFENSMTLVKNERNLLPLSDASLRIAIFSLSSDPGDYFAGRVFIDEIEKRCSEVNSFYADCFTGEKFLKERVKKASEADVIIFALFSDRRAWKGSVDLEPRHIQLVQEVARGSRPVIVVSFGSPYFMCHFPEVDSYLCAYGDAPQAKEAAVKALFGEIEVKGKLPVSLPDLYPLGHGLFLPKKKEKS